MDSKKTTAVSPSAQALAKDMELIKKTFKDKDALLLSVRALMFGIDLLDDERANIKSVFADPELRSLIQRRFLPDIMGSRELPLGQIQDVWLGAEQMTFGAPAMQIEQATKYKARSMEFTKHALVLLENPNGTAVPYKVSTYEDDPLQIDLMARNMYLRHVDQQLMMLSLIANQAEESPKVEAERRVRNSAK